VMKTEFEEEPDYEYLK